MRNASSQPHDHALRKRLGAWYTPPALVRLLVEWAVRSPMDRIMDPAVGDGAFLMEAVRRLSELGQHAPEARIWGVDINPQAVDCARSMIARSTGIGGKVNLRTGDFFALAPPRSLSTSKEAVDAVVGNPPFIRYQSFAGESRRIALDRALKAGVRLGGLSSSWAAFVVHSASFIKPGGRLALVLPEELLHSSYARSVRSFLRKAFAETAVVTFNRYIFPDSQERVVLLCASGKRDTGQAGILRLAAIESPEGLDDLDEIILEAETFAPGEDPGKWQAGFHDEGSAVLSELALDRTLMPLSDVGKASIGYVSGANDFFVLRPSEAEIRNFPRQVLLPTVIAARQVQGAVLTSSDLEALERRDERCLLWDGSGASVRAVAKYIREGVLRRVSRRYKCRVRDPWYVVPGVKVPDAFLTYMSDSFPRFVLNQARATCSNTLLAVRLNHLKQGLHSSFAASFYNSATLLSAEMSGRQYGGGVLKLEPTEAGRLLIPVLQGGVMSRRLGRVLASIDQLLRKKRAMDAIAFIDQMVLYEILGVARERIEALHSSWQRRCNERRRPGKHDSAGKALSTSGRLSRSGE